MAWSRRSRAVAAVIGVVVVGVGLLVANGMRGSGPTVDFAAEMKRIAERGQPVGPDATNGWAALEACAIEAKGIIDAIQDREDQADKAAFGNGLTPEPWAGRVDLHWVCDASLTPRDARGRDEALDAIERAGILERVRAACASDVFVIDFAGAMSGSDGPFGAPMLDMAGFRHLVQAESGALRRAVERSDWDGAIARIGDLRTIARAIAAQPGFFPALLAFAAHDVERDGGARTLTIEGGVPIEVLDAIGAPDGFGEIESADRVLEGMRFEVGALIDSMRDGEGDSAVNALRQAIPGMGFNARAARASIPRMVDRARSMRHRPIREIDAVRDEVAHANPRWQSEWTSDSEIGASMVMVVRLEALNAVSDAGFRVGVALARFGAAHGRMPESLEELVPEYLDAVPRDAYATDDRPLGYRAGAALDSTVVYSVGFDGRDNAGRAPSKSRYDALAPDGVGCDFVLWPPPCAGGGR